MLLIKDILKGIIYLFGALAIVAFIIILIFYILLNLNGQKGASPVDMMILVKYLLPVPLISAGLLGLIRLFEKK